MTPSRIRLHVILAWIVVILLTSIPYIYGFHISPKHYHFLGFTYNIDDACVYLSWMRQARDGHFFIHNLFTAEPQRFLPFNLLFLAMGLFSRMTSLSPALTFHIWRIALIFAVLLGIARICRILNKDDLAPIVIWLAALSSGLGWLLRLGSSINRPIDLWQPEAITFLSAYLNPLFLAGIALMLWTFGGLLCSVKENRLIPAIGAGISLFLLANIHTYDLIVVGLTWTAYTIYLLVVSRTEGWQAIKSGIVAAVVASPMIAYQVFLYIHEPVYWLRAQTPAESPAIWFYLIGYGFVLVFAVAGAVKAIRSKDRTAIFLMIWVLVGLSAIYLPFSQQRKLIMGTHVPLCILAATVLVPIIARVRAVRPNLAWAAILILLMPSNLLFLANDASLLQQNMTAPNFPAALSDDQATVLNWLSQKATPYDVILAPPDLALFIPALAGKRVYYGHWSETPDYSDKINEWFGFADIHTSISERAEFLRAAKITLVVQNLQTGRVGDREIGGPLSRDIARVVFRAGDLAVYRVSER